MQAELDLIVERIRQAAAEGTPLRIRGGGSKDFYGEPAQGELLDTRPLAGISSYEPSELVVTVRAGTPLAQLESVLAEQGQCLPFEPPHYAFALESGEPATTSDLDAAAAATAVGPSSTSTVGGMVAAGLSGPARASAGSVRDHVLGMTMVNGKGEVLTFGGQVMKNVAGYDVSRLMAGSLGTLGLIAEVSLKVLPKAPAEATLRFEMDQAEALRRLNLWGGQPLPLNASSWVEDGGIGMLYLRLRGAAAAVAAACAQLGGERQDNAAVAPDWDMARDLRLPIFAARGGRDLWRLSVPQTAPVLDLPSPPIIDWHGAQRWVMATRSDADRIRQACSAAKGHATLFIAGDDAASQSAASGTAQPPRFDRLAPALERIHRALKQQFDPAGILNPGRMYAGW